MKITGARLRTWIDLEEQVVKVGIFDQLNHSTYLSRLVCTVQEVDGEMVWGDWEFTSEYHFSEWGFCHKGNPTVQLVVWCDLPKHRLTDVIAWLSEDIIELVYHDNIFTGKHTRPSGKTSWTLEDCREYSSTAHGSYARDL